MEASPQTARLKAILIVGVSLLLAAFLGFMIGSEDYVKLLFGAMLVGVGGLWLFSGRFFWVIAVASSFLAGTFPFLRGSFTPFQILLMMGVVRFVFEDVVLRRRARLQIDRIDVILIALFMGILTINGVQDRFGMKFLGSTVWGGRNYVNVYVGLIAFFVIQSMPFERKLWNKLPYLILAVTVFDLAVALVTTVFPGTIYKIYPFYSAVSQASIDELVMGISAQAGRIGAFGNFGFVLILMVLATVSIRQLFHPSNFFKMMTAGFGAVCAWYSGFRSSVIQMLLGVLAAGIRDLKGAVVIFIPLLAVLLFALSFVNSEVVSLPRQIQRGLAFVPGNWDYDMARDVQASNDFRFRVWTLWWQDYFPKHPLLGRGFGFKSEWTKQSIYYRNPGAADHKQMVETGNIHNGLFASVDAIGIVGTLFFVAWNIRLLFLCFKVRFRPGDPAVFAGRFLALYLAVTVISYWGGATTIGSFLPGQFAVAGVFLRLRRETTSEDRLQVAPRPRHGPIGKRDLVPA